MGISLNYKIMITIEAQDLRKGDIIHYPASSISSGKDMTVIEFPVLESHVVRLFVLNKTNHRIPVQFGRKVDLQITRSEI